MRHRVAVGHRQRGPKIADEDINQKFLGEPSGLGHVSSFPLAFCTELVSFGPEEGGVGLAQAQPPSKPRNNSQTPNTKEEPRIAPPHPPHSPPLTHTPPPPQQLP